VNSVDTISFEKITVNGVCSDYTAAKIMINNEDFKIYLEKLYEIDYNYQEAGWLYKSLTSPRNAFDEYPGESAVFTCTCGVDECGGLYCRVSETENEVVWSGFHITSNYEIYNSLTPLYFDRTQYMAALAQLKNIVDNKDGELNP